MRKPPKISEEDILAWVDDDQRTFSRGEAYFQEGALSDLTHDQDTIYAKCRGSRLYDVWVKFNEDGVESADCSCPYDFNCKHMVALLFQWLERPTSFKNKDQSSKPKSPKGPAGFVDINQLTSSLASLLRGAQSSGSFCASGSLAVILPRIEIKGVGPLSFPVPEAQAKQLISIAERAPYGKGEETIVDTSVRRVWQISPGLIQIDENRGRPIIDTFTGITRTRLGIEAKVKAELYKMLIYDQGSFFVSHRDTEKSPGMFGTLIVVLPSWFEGGELIVSHSGRTETIQMTSNEPSVLSWAAFYADCLHELRPVAAGYRVALVYNLLRVGEATTTPSFQEVSQLTALLSQWRSAKRALPQKVAYVLAHQYTPGSLSFSALKGQDAIAASLLQLAAKESQCALYVAMISIEESGIAEGWGEDSFEIIEETERSQQIKEWVNPDDTKASLPPLTLEDHEISPPGALEDEEEDDVRFHEASGNEGASYEKSYRRAALVLWPQEKTLTVISKEGPGAMLSYIEASLREAQRSKSPKETSHWRDASRFTDELLREWPSAPDWKEEREPKMLSLLLRLEDASLLKRFIQDQIVPTHYNGRVNHGLVSACSILGLDELLSSAERIWSKHLLLYPEHCAALVFALSNKGRSDAFRGVADTMLKGIAQSLGKWELSGPSTSNLKSAEKELQKRATFVVHVMRALWSQQLNTHAEEAAVIFLQAPQRFPIDGVLLPAALQLKRDSSVGAGFERLLEACKRHLKERTSPALIAPSDWRRQDSVSCRCKDCKELKAFLVDPDKKSWDFKAAVARRDHVLRSIQESRCDVSTTTFKKSVPYILKCIKTTRSHSEQIEQRREDLANLAMLE